MRKGPVIVSVAIHFGAIVLLLLLASIPSVRDSVSRLPDRVVPLFAPRLAHQLKSQAAGGGQRNPLPASRGKIPPRVVTRVFVPPMAVRMENPKLAVPQAMVDAPEINIDAADIGDPMGKIGPLSGGPGGPSGIGDGTGRSIGNGAGPGGISYKALGITQEPELLHAEEPEYTDEARRARHQGSVLLAIDVDVNGRVTNIRVMRSLGLGLDEKAVAAVMKWKFRPAMAGGRPVTAPAQVQVTFHLL
jgi:periplasmic protein TonB